MYVQLSNLRPSKIFQIGIFGMPSGSSGAYDILGKKTLNVRTSKNCPELVGKAYDGPLTGLEPLSSIAAVF
jgi:hypothetical protein